MNDQWDWRGLAAIMNAGARYQMIWNQKTCRKCKPKVKE